VTQPGSAPRIDAQLREMLAAVLPRGTEVAPTLDGVAQLRESGLDSFGLIQLIDSIETTFHIKLDDDDLEERHFSTIEALGGLIAAKLAR
jgi:acyl carrier protein